MGYILGYATGCVVTFLVIFMGFRKNERQEKKRMNHVCTCKGCIEKREKEQRFLNHPFYQEVKEFSEEIETMQILKGAEKYKEPFNPDSWSGEELAIHAMQENRDQAVYITGLRDRMRKQEVEIARLKAFEKLYKQEIESRRKNHEN